MENIAWLFPGLADGHSPRDFFFDVASPTTLASLIADVDCLSMGADQQAEILRAEAYCALSANVGDIEADEMIDAAVAGIAAKAE